MHPVFQTVPLLSYQDILPDAGLSVDVARFHTVTVDSDTKICFRGDFVSYFDHLCQPVNDGVNDEVNNQEK